jgi:malonyl-CoA O-methyltransferase
VAHAPYRGKKILDLGAGSGEVYRNITWPIEAFYAVDASEQMLTLHPGCTRKILCDFDDPACWRQLERLEVDQVFAASSLQWSRDLDALLARIRSLTPGIALAIFTSGTFATLHRLAGITSPIRSKDEVIKAINKNFSANIEVRDYKLFFGDTLSMMRYIKRSGVSRGERRLSYKDMKRLIWKYPLSYLEFEVVFAWSKEQ